MDLVRNGQSPTRLKRILDQLVEKGYLEMNREGNQHRYKIKKKGQRHLAVYDRDTFDTSTGNIIKTLGEDQAVETILASPHFRELVDKLIERAPKYGTTPA